MKSRASRIGTKGQLVLDARIRKELGIEPGWLAYQKLVGDHVEIHFEKSPHKESLLGILPVKRKGTQAELERASEQGWVEGYHP